MHSTHDILFIGKYKSSSSVLLYELVSQFFFQLPFHFRMFFHFSDSTFLYLIAVAVDDVYSEHVLCVHYIIIS